ILQNREEIYGKWYNGAHPDTKMNVKKSKPTVIPPAIADVGVQCMPDRKRRKTNLTLKERQDINNVKILKPTTSHQELASKYQVDRTTILRTLKRSEEVNKSLDSGLSSSRKLIVEPQ
ncbi:hypothetical protein Ciccas_012947, partial [Cichlidogyrus casuarinus]